jgi:hypothetical protein
MGEVVGGEQAGIGTSEIGVVVWNGKGGETNWFVCRHFLSKPSMSDDNLYTVFRQLPIER